MMKHSVAIEPVIAIAQAGGALIARYFGDVLSIEEKSMASDVRTRADTESEATIIAGLSEAFPHISIYSEESGLLDRGSDQMFVIDPLDGSNNFVLGVPSFTVSIALMDGDESVMGVVYHPILNRTYYARRGGGAFLDGTPLHVNREAAIMRATVSYSCGYETPLSYAEAVAHDLYGRGIKRLIDFWSPAYDYCLLASGAIEGVINYHNDLYDYAAGIVLVREAGGTITGLQGQQVNGKESAFIASNGTALHGTLLQTAAVFDAS